MQNPSYKNEVNPAYPTSALRKKNENVHLLQKIKLNPIIYSKKKLNARFFSKCRFLQITMIYITTSVVKFIHDTNYHYNKMLNIRTAASNCAFLNHESSSFRTV